jgi:hypothetical protein
MVGAPFQPECRRGPFDRLGLGKSILGPIGPQWFYQGTTLGYRTLYVWFEKENLMITVQTNSQPAESKQAQRSRGGEL